MKRTVVVIWVAAVAVIGQGTQAEATHFSTARVVRIFRALRCAPEKADVVIMAGGAGTRLQPITNEKRHKPDTPFADVGRLIDFPLAGARKLLREGKLGTVTVLVQKAQGRRLKRHVEETWQAVFGDRLRVIMPEDVGATEFFSTGDCLDKVKGQLTSPWVFVLGGDHVYDAPLPQWLSEAKRVLMPASVGSTTRPIDQAKHLGVMKVHEGKVLAFEEKPDAPAPIEGDPENAFVSTGTYLFRRESLLGQTTTWDHGTTIVAWARRLFGSWAKSYPAGGLLGATMQTREKDLGHNLMPRAVKLGLLFEFPQGRWADVGTVGMFHRTVLESLLDSDPYDLAEFRALFPRERPVRHIADSATIVDSRLGHEAAVEGSVHRSALARGAHVGEEGQVDHSILMPKAKVDGTARWAIVGENAVVPAGYVLDGHDAGDAGLQSTILAYLVARDYVVRKEGILVVPDNTELPPYDEIEAEMLRH